MWIQICLLIFKFIYENVVPASVPPKNAPGDLNIFLLTLSHRRCNVAELLTAHGGPHGKVRLKNILKSPRATQHIKITTQLASASVPVRADMGLSIHLDNQICIKKEITGKNTFKVRF